MTDFQAEGGEQSITLEEGQMTKLLRYIVHTLEIFMWEQDYYLNPDKDDFFTDILPVPPIEEQKKIVGEIKEQTAKMQDIISVCQQEISVLQEFKTRLI